MLNLGDTQKSNIKGGNIYNKVEIDVWKKQPLLIMPVNHKSQSMFILPSQTAI